MYVPTGCISEICAYGLFSKEWLHYANWEVILRCYFVCLPTCQPYCFQASQNEPARARSVFERARDVDSSSIQLWLSHVEMELKYRNVQHARNLLDKAVTLLPRIDQLWYNILTLRNFYRTSLVPGRYLRDG